MMIEPWFPKSYKIINNLTLKQIEYSDDLWQIYSASSNQIVFRFGERGDKFYMILSGKVAILIPSPIKMFISVVKKEKKKY